MTERAIQIVTRTAIIVTTIAYTSIAVMLSAEPNISSNIALAIGLRFLVVRSIVLNILKKQRDSISEYITNKTDDNNDYCNK